MHLFRPRHNERLEIRIPCQMRVRGGRGKRLSGVTEHIGREEIQVRLNRCAQPPHFLRVGDTVSIFVDLPASGSAPTRCLFCGAIAVSMEDQPNGKVRATFRIARMSFRDRAESRPISASPVPETAGGRFVN